MGRLKDIEPEKVVRLIDRAKYNFAQRLAYWWNFLRFKFATSLSRQEQNISLQSRKVYFFIIFGALCLLCGYLLADGVNGFYGALNNKKADSNINLSFGNIHYVPATDPKETGLNKRERRVLNFITYLDSLKTTPVGRIKYDSINKARPGLMDSLRLIKLSLSN
jgi:hypothetical protein